MTSALNRDSCHGKSVNPSLIAGVYLRQMNEYIYLAQFSPGLKNPRVLILDSFFFFVQPIKPRHTHCGSVERGFVTYLGWWNSSFMQQDPGDVWCCNLLDIQTSILIDQRSCCLAPQNMTQEQKKKQTKKPKAAVFFFHTMEICFRCGRFYWLKEV